MAVEGQYKHVKQTGGRGQYAHVCLRLEPLDPGRGFEFVNEVMGGRIPPNSSRPSRRASSRPWSTGPSPATRWWTCA